MNKVKAPCNGCDNRHLGCHGECEKYKTFADENKKLKQQKLSKIDFTYAQYFRDKRTKRLRDEKRCGK